MLERIYKNYPGTLLPADLTGQPVISARGRKVSTAGPTYTGLPNMFPGWNPYAMAGSVSVPPGPSYQIPPPSHPATSMSNTPFYSPHSTIQYNNNNGNPENHQQPSDDDEDVEYPTITAFLEELEVNDRDHHYFTHFTEAFHQHCYY